MSHGDDDAARTVTTTSGTTPGIDAPSPEPASPSPTVPAPTSPDSVAAALTERPDAPLLVDLDETLVLGPTTEAFLDAARPASVVALVLAVLDKVGPWRLLPGGRSNRDWIRVLAVVLVAPWALVRWRTAGAEWARSQRNHGLVDDVLAHRGDVVVVTRGFDRIVRPVVAELGLDDAVACKLWRWRGQRQVTKPEMLAASSFGHLVDDAILVTDSLDDLDLLRRVRTPLLVRWPGAEWIDPHTDAYRPLRYVTRTKPPAGEFVQVAWLTDDLYVTAAAFAAAAWYLPLQVLGVAIACLAMWVLYEAGYHENDVLGAEREADPVLPDNFHEVADSVSPVEPWWWAAGFTLLAAPLLTLDSLTVVDVARVAALWFAVVAATRGVFALFNRLPKRHRVVPHLLLQVGKYAGLAAVLPIAGPTGVALVVGQIAFRWFPYVGYRWMSGRFEPRPIATTRFVVFLAVAVPGLVVVDHSAPQLVLFALATAWLGRRMIDAHR